MPDFEDVEDLAHKARKGEQAFVQQAQRLAHLRPSQEDEETGPTQAVEAKFVTPLDPVVETANGKRLPTIPVEEAAKLNKLRDEVDGHDTPRSPPRSAVREGRDGTLHGARLQSPPAMRKPAPGNEILNGDAPNKDISEEKALQDKLPDAQVQQDESPDASLGEAIPPSRTNPLFPPLPMYGPPTPLRSVQSSFFRVVSSFLSLGFLLAIVAGAIADAIPRILRHLRKRAALQNPKHQRPFYDEEIKRAQERRVAEKAWAQQQKGKGAWTPSGEKGDSLPPQDGAYVPTEGGPVKLCTDYGYYARRVGLDAESFEVMTEDGFIIELVHIYNPREYRKPSTLHHGTQSPDLFTTTPDDPVFGEAQPFADGRKKYPVLMIHGLLQAAGAYCCNDDDSLAFYLAKSGYDVWLGNNRCGFEPKHTMLKYEDPRMWAWNIRQMGVMDLPALISRVLAETGFSKLALIAHSQGTTETFVALAKEQRPDIGNKISVFCALAPAVYAGPLIGKIYFKVMRLIGPAVFRLVFGIHAFIPLMMTAHKILPSKFYSWFGYHVFSFLFSWSDARWDRGLRDRMFQWAPVYVSAESMRWWLGRECFAKQKCILATREEGQLEDKEDEEDDEIIRKAYIDREPHITERKKLQRNLTSFHCQALTHQHHDATRGKYSWYDKQFPPLALWVAGADNLVDGRRLLRRFDRGREPHVRVVHKKIIEGYEHLDVIWAMDAIEKVGKEVREVIWRTADPKAAAMCRTPVGCNQPVEEDPPIHEDVPMMHSGGRLRMASISEGIPKVGSYQRRQRLSSDTRRNATAMDASAEREGEHDYLRDEAKKFGRPGDGEALFTDVEEKENPLG